MKNVLIPTSLKPVAKEILEEQGFNVVQDSETPQDELFKQHPETEVIIVRSDKIDADAIDSLANLKLIVRAGAGYNTIDIKHARRQGVDVMNTPGANSNAVAEEVIALMLAHIRHIVPADQSVRSGKWEKKKFMGRELAGKTVGVVGLGNIGQLVVRRLKGFDCKIIGYDPAVSHAKARDLGVKCMPMEDVFKKADFITLHIPETEETKGVINKDLFDSMKEGAVLVNCARAGIINEDDLRQAKKEKDIGFCNDVYPKDEAGEKSVADIADVMLPHLGASTVEANTNAARRAAKQIIDYTEHGVTKYVVNSLVPPELDEIYLHLAYQVAFLARRFLGRRRSIRHVECSFYGDLQDYAEYFKAPIVAGISADFDALDEPAEAGEYLEEKGTSYEVRPVDESKGYGNSITLDLMEGDDDIRSVSIRGTLTEGKTKIARLNDYDEIYFEPEGHTLLVEYEDRPGVLAFITRTLADYDINIIDIRAPQNDDATKALAVVKTDHKIPGDAVERIKKETNTERVVATSLLG
ncbi:MAG: NAD(P)-dependent oxidoreductase [Lentisphaeria bacterium]